MAFKVFVDGEAGTTDLQIHARKTLGSPDFSMIVFDVDGTLVEGEPTDWRSFDDAFEEAAGFVLESAFFDSLEERTAQAIVHHALGTISFEKKKEIERAVQFGYLARLKKAHENDPYVFPAAEGAVQLLEDLKQRGIPVAIATGDWLESITFKLGAARIPFEGIPIATASDHYSRADIIVTAVAKAGGTLDKAIYVGDGPWDYRACKKLGIPFIGVGQNREKLREAGASHILPDFHPERFRQMIELAKKPKIAAFK